MNKEELVVAYDECQELTSDYQNMVVDYCNRLELAKRAKTDEEFTMDMQTMEFMENKLQEAATTLEDKIQRLEICVGM